MRMTRGRGFSSFRGGSGRSWGGPSDSFNSSGNNMRFSSFSNSMDRPRYQHNDRYRGSTRPSYDDYHKSSYRSDMSSSYSGRDSHRSPDRKRLREEAPRRREVDSFSSSSNRYTSSSMHDRSFRDRRPPPPPTISRRDDFRRPLPPTMPRGGFRGRMNSRGMRGMRPRDGPPRRRLVESSYTIRRRLPPPIPTDYSRRLKVSRLRSAITRRAVIRRNEGSEKGDSDDEKKLDDDEKIKKENDDVKEGSDEEGNDEERKEKDDSKKEKEKDEGDASKSPKREYVKLVCPHCNLKCPTFLKYNIHLHSSKHMLSMRQVAIKQKTILSRMRLSQRNAQREMEKNSDDLVSRTNFCPLCKLNYKQPKSIHQGSESHKTMKRFLMPYCKVCKLTFKSPMIYETHICSIEHLKRKSRIEVNNCEKSDNDSEDLPEHFMTIDSVGDVDDTKEAKKDKESAESEGKKVPVNVGIEKIKKVEVYYCELCRMYLPRVSEDDLQKTLTKHCKQRTHLQRYIIYKEDKDITKRAEKLQRRETAEKEREKKVKVDVKDDQIKAENDNEKGQKDKLDEDDTLDDKLWADDVNKDLGDILAEAESGNKTSDDEYDERFDRFGTSEKNGDEVAEATDKQEKSDDNEKK